MSIDFNKDRELLDRRESAVRAWLDALDAERAAEQHAQDLHSDALDADLKAAEARKRAKDAFEAAKTAITDETEFAGYGFTSVAQAVAAIADTPPASPDPSDQPEMGNDEAEAEEWKLNGGGA